MLFDLTQLTPSQIAIIAAGATLVAAMLGGIFALAVASVNAWSATQIARTDRRHKFLLTVLEPYLAALDQEIHPLKQALELMLAHEGQAISTGNAIIQILQKRERVVFRKTAIHGLLHADTAANKRLRAAIALMASKGEELDVQVHEFEFWLLETFRKKQGGDYDWVTFSGGPSRREAVIRALKETLNAALGLRAEVDRYLFA